MLTTLKIGSLLYGITISLQVYNLKGSAGMFNIAKTGIVQPYVFLDADNVKKIKQLLQM